ncbi:MAG: tRNA (adenosine(37)-N6)-threonylcarbamoyltransferase complex dimerization subunit type 1 TsaB [Burkholderiaceae bacterium]|jgi:tRNA threonylcarbamoyladenosine biosynthesis protein TsaB|nr:tRNA (adenosine(37)-N6)-threonylcarbamoyltransferase complex dimerization subunit type 1 TsaB [Burkholderiaceae bacterium]
MSLDLLAFDTSTEQLSVAVQRADGVRQRRQAAGGARASAALIPSVQALLAQAGLALGELRAIVFGRGPGSFTGLRTACSVAQGLAFGAGVPALPVDTLLAVAEAARRSHGATRVLALLDARMDELYSAAYVHDGDGWRALSGIAVGRPEALLAPSEAVGGGWALAGNAFEPKYVNRLPPALQGWPRIEAAPTADALLDLAPALLAAGLAVPAGQALPLYIRDKVAQTTAERIAVTPGAR